MEKNDIPLVKLAEHYFITCHTEGKTPSTVRGYREKLWKLKIKAKLNVSEEELEVEFN